MNSLKSIRIQNYKCFNNVSFNIKAINILIGENNAGKSTTIEAIKLLAFAIEKLKLGHFIDCPESISDIKRYKCIFLKIDSLAIDIDTASYKYQGGNSHIVGYFDKNIRVEVYIVNNEVYAMAFANNNCLTNRTEVSKANIPSIFVMPHFNLLRDEETLIDEKRTVKDRFNYRSSLHFRNELLKYKEDIPDLNELLRITWRGLHLSTSYILGENKYIDTQIRDNDFSSEIRKCGSGLQMWVQILWFLCKIKDQDCIVVLDEPDVYIHADLQRKLYHLVSDRYSQVIIATHSIEIINEANLDNIMIVDKRQKSFKFCNKKSNLENVLVSIGTTHNLMLTKLSRYNKCLFVEGKDIDILDEIYKIAINDKTKSIKDFATCKLDGKNNYKESFGAAKIFYDDSDGTFKTFCLLDRDYSESFNTVITQEATTNKVKLHILKKLEIENYLIIPRIFAELLKIDISVVNSKLEEITEQLKGSTFDRVLEGKVLEHRKLEDNYNLAKISKETREYIDCHWTSLDEKISLVPGKELKSNIYDWMKAEYSFSCNDKKILSKMVKSDIPHDLLEFLNELSK